jgi:hypothetical protein
MDRRETTVAVTEGPASFSTPSPDGFREMREDRGLGTAECLALSAGQDTSDMSETLCNCGNRGCLEAVASPQCTEDVLAQIRSVVLRGERTGARLRPTPHSALRCSGPCRTGGHSSTALPARSMWARTEPRFPRVSLCPGSADTRARIAPHWRLLRSRPTPA